MRFLTRILACFLLIFSGSFFIQTVHAGNFTEVLIRPDRTKAGIAPGDILVEVNPASIGTESKLVLQLDSRWTAGTHFSTTASDYTTTTVGIPSGLTPLPLTGFTASSITGHTLTFAIGDLSPGTTYAFFISGGFPLNRSAAEYLTVVSTQDAGSTVIDTQNVWTETTANDQIVINAIVPPATSNLTATLTPDQHNELNRQDTELGYTFTYGTDAMVTGPMTLQASWDLGTPEGQTTASQDILEYVIGSATNAYGNTPPVIDTVNRTITWSIASYPANLPNQSVHFTLKTNEQYTGEKKVVIPIHAQIIAPAQSEVATQTITYLYVNTSTNTPTPTPIAVTSTGSPTVSAPLGSHPFTSIALGSLFDTSAIFSVRLSAPANLTVRYGLAPKALTGSFSTTAPLTVHEINIPGLKDDTHYYVVFDVYQDGRKITSSDIFTFKTAKTDALMPKAITESFVLLQDGSPIYGEQSDQNGQRLSIVANQLIDLQLSISHGDRVKSAVTSLRPAKILGLTDDATSEPDLAIATLMQIAPDKFVGKMRTPEQTDTYLLMLRVESKTGSVEEKPIATIRLIQPLIIQDEKGNPIENVHASVKRYDKSARIYLPIRPGGSSVKGLLLSDHRGRLPFNLSAGQYEIELRSIGYATQTIRVTISFDTVIPYPTLTLKRLPFSLALFTSYYTNIGQNIVEAGETFLQTLTDSPRFWDLFFLCMLLFILFCLVTSVSLRLGIPVIELIPAFLEHLSYMKSVHTHQIFHGTIHNSVTGEAIAGARVTLKESEKNAVHRFATTNMLGEFALLVPTSTQSLCFSVDKKGFDALSECVPSGYDVSHALTIRPNTHPMGLKAHELLDEAAYLLIDFGLEFFIVLALLCELYLLLANKFALFGSFFVLTLLCIGVWTYWKHLWSFKMSHLQSW